MAGAKDNRLGECQGDSHLEGCQDSQLVVKVGEARVLHSTLDELCTIYASHIIIGRVE